MSKYQLGFILFFVSVGVLGVLVFAGLIDLPNKNNNQISQGLVSLTIWGTFEKIELDDVLSEFNKTYRDRFQLTYVKKDKESLELDFLRALSTGEIPDLLLFPNEILYSLEGQLYTIPEVSLQERQFKELFVEGSEIYIKKDGIVALPILADPIVMYWNRDLFNNERLTEVPDTWDEILVVSRALSKKDNRQKILQSAIALGESANITHFKDILALLFFQTGDFILQRSKTQTTNSGFEVLFGSGTGAEEELLPAESALSFYTGFSDPKLAHYSWNTSFNHSIDEFVSGNLAMYIGFASDLDVIKKRNPHLNFDVAPIPQLSNTPRAVTYGKYYALSVPKLSKNVDRALEALFLLTISDNRIQTGFSDALALPPTKRILLSEGHQDPFLSTFYEETAITKTWIDPNPSETEAIFGEMVNSVTAQTVSDKRAVSNAKIKLNNIFER